MDAAVIAVEGNYADILSHQYESDANPMSVTGKINTIYHRFGIPTIFLSSPTCMAVWVENFFTNYLKKYDE